MVCKDGIMLETDMGNCWKVAFLNRCVCDFDLFEIKIYIIMKSILARS